MQQLGRSAVTWPRQASPLAAPLAARFTTIGSRLSIIGARGAHRAVGGPGASTAELGPHAKQIRGHSHVTHATSRGAAGGDAPRVVILGGGFGGLYTAVRLNSLFWPKGKKPQVTVVDQSERFVFKPLLYELLSGAATEGEVAPTFSKLLAPYPIRFIQAKAKAATPDDDVKEGGGPVGGVVELEGGSTLDYDYLVLALGSKVDTKGVRGAKERAVPFNTLDDAVKARDALDAIERRARRLVGAPPQEVFIVGAGYAGVELASVVAERLRGAGLGDAVKVSIITPGDTILEGAPDGQRTAAEEVLSALGVAIVTRTRVRSLDAPAAPDALPTAAAVNLDDPAPTVEEVKEAVADKAASIADAAATAAASIAAAATDIAEGLRNPDTAKNGKPKAESEEEPTNGNGNGKAATAKSSDRTQSKKAAAKQEEPEEEEDGGEAKAEGKEEEKEEDEEKGAGYRTVEADLVLWTAGSAPAIKGARAGFPFPTTSKGSLKTDAALRVLSQSRVFALGDVSVAEKDYVSDGSKVAEAASDEPGTASFPATAQVAFQQADYVAWNVWAAIAGRPLLPFRYQHLGSMMSLGTFNAAVQLPSPLPGQLQASLASSPAAALLNGLGVKLSPDARGVTLEGPLAALLRRAAYLYRQPTNEQRLSVITDWVTLFPSLASNALSKAGVKLPNSR